MATLLRLSSLRSWHSLCILYSCWCQPLIHTLWVFADAYPALLTLRVVHNCFQHICVVAAPIAHASPHTHAWVIACASPLWHHQSNGCSWIRFRFRVGVEPPKP